MNVTIEKVVSMCFFLRKIMNSFHCKSMTQVAHPMMLWYDNSYVADHPKEMTFAMEAVQELRPAIAKIAAEVNKGAYERSVASTSFAAKATRTNTETVIEETVKET
jgi:hypothetical protein